MFSIYVRDVAVITVRTADRCAAELARLRAFYPGDDIFVMPAD